MSSTLRGLGCHRKVLFYSYLSSCHCCVDHFFSTQPFEEYFKVVAAQTTITRGAISNWTPWYVELTKKKVKCQICRDILTKKNGRMLNHLGYICNSGERDNNVKFCKNMKRDMACAFCGCGGVAPIPPNLHNCSIFKVVRIVKNQYTKAVRAL